ALESKDPYLKGHSARVSLYSGEIAKVMAMTTTDVVLYSRAGLLHDLGKLVMLDNILRKPRQLTEEEFELVRSHPVVGDKILKPLRFLSCEAKAVRHHHERYDGKGYPDGLKGDGIPFIARVVTVADAFDAMTSDRPYRSKRPIEAAIDEISRGARTQFDPLVAEAFITIQPARPDAISRQFDLLVVDYKMPGMNGFEVLEQARQVRPDMACMLMTAHGTPDIINEATRLGFNYILLKPFTPSELRGAVDKVLSSKS